MAWDLFPNDPTAIRASMVEAQRQGPACTARLAALCLCYVGKKCPPSRAYQGPGGHLPLEYLSQVLRALQANGDYSLPTWNVDPDRIRDSYERLAGHKEVAGTARILELLKITCADYPPDKVRASKQQDILAFCAARHDLAGCELCIDYLLATFSHMGAWWKLEHRAADVVAALWDRRSDWQPLLFRFASELLVRKAHQAEETDSFDIWTQVQATCGVGHALRSLAGKVELAEFERYVDAWPAAEVPQNV
jgi:hypothetical protein